MSSTLGTPAHDFEVFFDGDCPLCTREIALLRRWDTRQRIRFTDIAGDGFDARDYGTDQQTLMAEIHGRTSDGEWVTGVEVFRQLYGAVGFDRTVRFTRLPAVAPALDFLYRRFARNRLALTGRKCDDACAIATPPSHGVSYEQ